MQGGHLEMPCSVDDGRAVFESCTPHAGATPAISSSEWRVSAILAGVSICEVMVAGPNDDSKMSTA